MVIYTLDDLRASKKKGCYAFVKYQHDFDDWRTSERIKDRIRFGCRKSTKTS